jgi:hypothetical protein
MRTRLQKIKTIQAKRSGNPTAVLDIMTAAEKITLPDSIIHTGIDVFDTVLNNIPTLERNTARMSSVVVTYLLKYALLMNREGSLVETTKNKRS